MNDAQLLIAAIHRNPHDRLAVKVYADWLQENRDVGRFAALRTATKARRPILKELEVKVVKDLLIRRQPLGILAREIVLYALPPATLIHHRYHVVDHWIWTARGTPGDPVFITNDVRQVVWVYARWLLRRIEVRRPGTYHRLMTEAHT